MPPELRIVSVGYEGGGPVIWIDYGDGYGLEALRLTNAEAFALLTNLARAIKFPGAGA